MLALRARCDQHQNRAFDKGYPWVTDWNMQNIVCIYLVTLYRSPLFEKGVSEGDENFAIFYFARFDAYFSVIFRNEDRITI